MDFRFLGLACGALLASEIAYAEPTVTIDPHADPVLEDRIFVEGASDALSGLRIQVLAQSLNNQRAILSFNYSGTENVSLRRETPLGPVWMRPDLENRFLVHDGQDLDLLLYGNSAGYSYNISDPKLEICQEPYTGDCISDGDLVVEIQSRPDFPHGAGDEALALYLLDWASNDADYAASSSLHDILQRSVSALGASAIRQRFFVPNVAGGYCGGLSDYTAKVLRLFGLDAFTVNFGSVEDVLTHVSVIWRPTGTDNFYMLDPTFNGQFRTGANMADIIDVTADAVTWEFHHESIADRELLFASNDPDALLVMRSNGMTCKFGDGNSVCDYPGFSIEKYLENYSDELAAAGIPATSEALPALMRLGIYHVGPSLVPESRDMFLAQMAAIGIPAY